MPAVRRKRHPNASDACGARPPRARACQVRACVVVFFGGVCLFVCRHMCVRRSVFPPRPRVTPRCDGASLPRWGSFSLSLLAEKRCICVFRRKPRLLCRPKLRKRTSLLCCGFSRGIQGGLISGILLSRPPLVQSGPASLTAAVTALFKIFFLFRVREATFLLPSLLARCRAVVPPSPWQRALQRQRAPAERASARVGVCERCARVCLDSSGGGHE